MSEMRHGEPKLIFPGLAGFYQAVWDLWYPLIRVTVGALLFVHGWTKVTSGVAGVTGFFEKNGFVPASGFAYAAIFLETVGAVCIVLGLFTRAFAAMIAIQMRGGGPYSLDRVIGKHI